MKRKVKVQKSNGPMLKNFFFILFIFIQLTTLAQDSKTRWVDSVFQILSPSEKISQLFWVQLPADPGENDFLKYKPGGILITQSGPVSHANRLNKLQQNSDVPLLITRRGWETEMQVDSLLPLQAPWLLGASTQPELVVKAGVESARQQQLLGIHGSLLPVPLQTHETFHSYRNARFKETHLNYLKGLSTANSFTWITSSPEADTALTRQLLKLANGAVSAHTRMMDFEADERGKLDEDSLLPRPDYSGLLIADIPYLKQLAGKQPDGEVELAAIYLGHEVLMGSDDVAAAIRKITKAMRKDKELVARVDVSVKKILELKYEAGLAHNKIINTDNLVARLNNPEAKLLRHSISESTITVLNNRNQVLPVVQLENRKFASLSVGNMEPNEFARYLSKYAPFKHFSLGNGGDIATLKPELLHADVLVVGLFDRTDASVISFLQNFPADKQLIICHFGDLVELAPLKDFPVLLTGYTPAAEVQKIAAQVVFGGMPANGVLPFAIPGAFEAGTGIRTAALNRLSYTLPEAAGVDSKTLEQIETIAGEAIHNGATPGSYVLVVKDGKVIYDRASGWLTYDKTQPVTENTLYDLASITKVAATLQTVMFIHEKGLIDVNKKASVYLPELKKSNKKDYTLKDILTHQAGLWPFLPFWSGTIKDNQPLPEYYNTSLSNDYPFPVTQNMFASKAMKDSLWQWIIKARVQEKPPRTVYSYRYSDMGFYILQHLAEKLLNQPMEDFLEQNLYEPLGAYTLGYLPLQRFSPQQIAPTEDDKLFRKSLLVGYVHDQGAAMHGNIAGHAGLFGNANDLAKLGQMLLQKGSYGGHQFYKPETVESFTTKQYETSRRGLGWDKPTVSDWNGPTTLFASPLTFGHTGFTGTCIWVDPQFNLVFIYLSNRVHPDMTNNKLLNANIRPRVQEVIYRAIFNYRQY
ncbi:MAG: serine hydrolase [Cyclobacteriaceae bacterium]|nr:serine hydrolase [Cyclobacteriaceae bacterium]